MGNSQADALTPVRCCGQWIDLMTVEAFENLPDGTVVMSISGAYYTKGVDNIDLDTRGGQIAFGLPAGEERAKYLTDRYGAP